MTSVEFTFTMRQAATWSRPRTSMVSGSSSFIALPMVILTSSAVLSPMIRLYLRRMYAAIASFSLLPATRTEFHTTMPYQITAAWRCRADVHHHIAGGRIDREVRAECGGQGSGSGTPRGAGRRPRTARLDAGDPHGTESITATLDPHSFV